MATKVLLRNHKAFMPSSQAFGEDAYATSCGSLLFAFEGEDAHGSASITLRAAATASHQASMRERLSFLTRPSNDCVMRLHTDVRRFKRTLLREDGSSSGSVDVVSLAARLAAVGHSVTIRTALGGGPCCFKNLRHVFLRVRGDAEFAGAEFIVDPNFREHFAIPHATDAYAATLALLPDEFVGSASRLVPLVQVMCSEMAASFEARGLPLPPWRRAPAVLSKWLPQRMSDVPLSCGCSGSSSGGKCSGGCGPGGDSDDEGLPLGDAASPFSRVSVGASTAAGQRVGSGRSLLSGKLGAAAAGAAKGRAAVAGAATVSKGFCAAGRPASGAGGMGGAGAAGTASNGAVCSSGPGSGAGGSGTKGNGGGTVSRCPQMYRGEPPTYSVKLPKAPAT